MKNNKGITLITVVVMIIIIIIIATTSLLNASKLMNNSRDMAMDQKIETVRQAVKARQSEIGMQGSIAPTGDQQYVGKYSPLIAQDSIEAKGWYLLNEEALKDLGVNNLREFFLVNYQKGIVIPLLDEHHVEKYLVYAFISKVCDKKDKFVISEYIGEKLSNSSSSENESLPVASFSFSRILKIKMSMAMVGLRLINIKSLKK